MKFIECMKSTPGISDLKRLASEYVIDFRRLNIDELREAIAKTAPQYYNDENVRNTVKHFNLNQNRTVRVLFSVIVKLLLNSDDFTLEAKILEDKVLSQEQEIVDLANEFDGDRISDDLEFFKYVLEAAWEHNDDVSIDEQNLLNKIKAKLGISDIDYCVLEAHIGKYPNPNNELHTKGEINDVRRAMQAKGLLVPIKDSNGVLYDAIPSEIAAVLRKIYGIDIKKSSYEILLDSKYVKGKKYFSDIIAKAGHKVPATANLTQLKQIILDYIPAKTVLAGFSPNDGLDKATLIKWCGDLKIAISGTKPELVDRIVNYYDELRQIKADEADERAVFFDCYEELACRDLNFLRQQGIIDKDLECEHKFEIATNYMFENIFKVKPLLLSGTEHADGVLSFKDKLIMWDNKSKETDVNLADHIKQFERYINNSSKPVAVFMVIASSFTENSAKECINFSMNSDTLMLLITASDLKQLSQKWLAKHSNDEEALPLGVFKQNGRFNLDMIDL